MLTRGRRPHLRRRTTAVLILAAWAGALGWLAQRHYLGGDRTERSSRWPVPPGSAYHSVRLGDRQYGLASVTIDTLPEGLRVTELVTVDLPALQDGVPRRTSLRIEARYARGLQLRSWRGDLLTEHGRRFVTGSVIGDSVLTVVNRAGDVPPETLTVRLRRPIILPSAIPLVVASRGLPRTGSRLNLEVYDPLDQELRTDRLLVAAESLFTVPDSAEFNETLGRWRVAHADTVRAWRIDGTEHGLPVSRWVDAAGMTVRIVHPLGAHLDRSAFELVNTNYRALPPPLWDTSAAAPSLLPGTGRDHPRPGLTVLAYLAPRAPVPEGVPSLEGGWQRRTGDTLHIARRTGWDSVPDRPDGRAARLEENPELMATATRIVGAERRPEAMARALNTWVRRTITLREGVGGSAAARVLARKSGTAEERVVLLVALAHAAGLAARPVWGVVREGEHWQLATWAEIHAGVWVPVDPGSPGATTGTNRVRLAIGGEGRLLDLALRAGRLRLAVLEESS